MRTEYVDMLKKLKADKKSDVNDRVMIVDGLNMFIRVFGAVPTLNDDGQHVGGITGFLLSLGARIRDYKPTRVLVVFDGKGGSAGRKKIYSEYKSGRSGITKLNRLAGYEDLEDQERSMKEQFLKLIGYLDYLPVDVCSIDHIEADDVIAYAANHVFQKEVQIVSTDRDFIQLVNDRISVYLPSKKVIVTESKAQEIFGVLPSNVIYYRIMDGDTSDDIKGINGIGPKTIESKMSFLREAPIKDLDEFMSKIDTIDNDRIRNLLVDNKDILERNYRIMQLADPEIGSALKSNIRNIINSPVNQLNSFGFKQQFMVDKLYTAFKNVEYWLGNTWNELDKFAKTTHK